MKPSNMQLLIVGGGIAGFNLLKKLLKQSSSNLHITVADPSQDFVFKPMLYEQLNGRDVTVNRDIFFHRNAGKVTFLPTRALNCYAISGNQFEVAFENGERKTFDCVVLAMGSKTNYFGVVGADEFALPLLTQEDMDRLGLQLEKKLSDSTQARFEIVGAGLSGVELAFELRAYCETQAHTRYPHLKNLPPEITLIEGRPTILPGFAEGEQQHITQKLLEAGISLLTDHQVDAVEADGLWLKHQGERVWFPSEQPLWVAGLKANLPNGFFNFEAESYPMNGRLKVTPQLSIPNYPQLFVIGDLCGTVDDKTQRLVPPSGQLAEQQAAYVSQAIQCLLKNKPVAAMAPFKASIRGHFVSLGPKEAAMMLDSMPGPMGKEPIIGGFVSTIRQAYYSQKLKTS